MNTNNMPSSSGDAWRGSRSAISQLSNRGCPRDRALQACDTPIARLIVICSVCNSHSVLRRIHSATFARTTPTLSSSFMVPALVETTRSRYALDPASQSVRSIVSSGCLGVAISTRQLESALSAVAVCPRIRGSGFPSGRTEPGPLLASQVAHVTGVAMTGCGAESDLESG